MDRRRRFSRSRPWWPRSAALWPGVAACPRAAGPTYRARLRPGAAVPGDATTHGSGTAPLTTRPGTAAKGFAQANSIPFPVAVGNTWIYQTQRRRPDRPDHEQDRRGRARLERVPGHGVLDHRRRRVGHQCRARLHLLPGRDDRLSGPSGQRRAGDRRQRPLAGRRGSGFGQGLPLRAADPGR